MTENDNNFSQFNLQLMQLGILAYKEQETMRQIALRCAKTAGLSTAGAGALMGMNAGTVVIPGIGTVAGSVAGAIAGMFAGTLSCTMLNVSMREQLRKIATGE